MKGDLRKVLSAILFVLVASSCKESKPPGPTSSPTPTPTATPVPTVTPKPSPTPPPVPSLPRKPIDLAKLYSGITVTSTFATPASDELASVDRNQEKSYTLEVKLTAKLPRASVTLEDLAENDPKLPLVLNQMGPLVEKARVSPYFEKLYSLKTAWIKERLWKLDQVLTRHNFYDCETILELTGSVTGRKALLFVGDMDVNTDGSDGDRNYPVDGTSQYFQPQTSYRWRKTTERPNPFLSAVQKKLDTLKHEYGQKGLSAERNRDLKDAIGETERRLYDVQTWSFLISEADPFIVLPGFVLRDAGSAFSPQIGDYAVVIYEGNVYPAIVGDAGPSFKMGEASLRLCKQLNPKSSAFSRPVSNLKVSYLVFPGTAETAAPPDLAKWTERCKTLLDEIGGTAPEIFTWANIVPPWPTPTPVLEVVPEASGTPSPLPTEAPSPTPAETIINVPSSSTPPSP